MRMSRAAVPLLTLGLVLAACSASTTAPRRRADRRPRHPAAASAAPVRRRGRRHVNLADSTLGKVLADGTGKTLYVFTPVAAAAGKSVCNGDCATNWPPLTSDAAPTLGHRARRRGLHDHRRDDGTSSHLLRPPALLLRRRQGRGRHQRPGRRRQVVRGRGRRQHDRRPASPAASAAASAAAGGSTVALADNALGKILVGATTA